jgi:hypothetical protein
VTPGHPGSRPSRGEIEWTEPGQLFSIRLTTYAYARFREQDLIVVGDRLP